MDARAQLILTRAKELLARDEPGTNWVDAIDRPDDRAITRQGAYLSRAEHQLLAEGRIDSVDQS
ncbi:MAG: hypothetical protein AB7F09_02600 [Parvibaculaceae bacterium]